MSAQDREQLFVAVHESDGISGTGLPRCTRPERRLTVVGFMW
jgi:hypothetical protein